LEISRKSRWDSIPTFAFDDSAEFGNSNSEFLEEVILKRDDSAEDDKESVELDGESDESDRESEDEMNNHLYGDSFTRKVAKLYLNALENQHPVEATIVEVKSLKFSHNKVISL
jgi:hypothetical protein